MLSACCQLVASMLPACYQHVVSMCGAHAEYVQSICRGCAEYMQYIENQSALSGRGFSLVSQANLKINFLNQTNVFLAFICSIENISHAYICMNVMFKNF